jgi:ParB family chromosome partitioning protein
VAKGRLGKGLGALLPEEDYRTEGNNLPARPAAGTAEIIISLDALKANPGQPRKRFGEAQLEELAASIKLHGLIQPVIVDEDRNGGYIIIAGERRARAARLAGLAEIPVIVRRYSEQKRLEVALIENIHRADLNPIEEAAAYKQLMETGGLSQDEAAERVGKNRSTVANALRLLKLPASMREALEEGSISAGHARALLSLGRAADQEKLFAEINARGLSVRMTENRAAELAGKTPDGKGGMVGANGGNAGDTTNRRDPELKALEEKFIETLGTRVVINGSLARGRVEIDYYSMDDLDRLYRLLQRDS